MSKVYPLLLPFISTYPYQKSKNQVKYDSYGQGGFAVILFGGLAAAEITEDHGVS
jgi:hypothetical protein